MLITTRNEASFVVQQHDPSFQRDKDEISCSAVLLREIFQGPDSVSGSVVLLLTMQYDKSLLERFAYKRVALIFQCSTWGLRDMLDASSESEKCSRRILLYIAQCFITVSYTVQIGTLTISHTRHLGWVNWKSSESFRWKFVIWTRRWATIVTAEYVSA